MEMNQLDSPRNSQALLANPLAKSFPASAQVFPHPGRAALGQPSGVARLAHEQPVMVGTRNRTRS